MNNTRPFLNRRDLLIIPLLFAFAMLAALPAARGAPAGNALVYCDGERIKTIPLDKDGLFSLGDGFPKMAFAVNDGEIRVVRSDCRDKICVNSGSLRSGNKTIVCLPNRVMVKLDRSKDDIDVFL
jgi:hypothetical protein